MGGGVGAVIVVVVGVSGGVVVVGEELIVLVGDHSLCAYVFSQVRRQPKFLNIPY